MQGLQVITKYLNRGEEKVCILHITRGMTELIWGLRSKYAEVWRTKLIFNQLLQIWLAGWQSFRCFTIYRRRFIIKPPAENWKGYRIVWYSDEKLRAVHKSKQINPLNGSQDSIVDLELDLGHRPRVRNDGAPPSAVAQSATSYSCAGTEPVTPLLGTPIGGEVGEEIGRRREAGIG